jgi:hypothetical protein
MGYRSELHAVVGLVDLLEFERLIKEADLADCFEEHDKSDLAVEFRASHLKWYDGYADVDKINEFFNNSKFSILLRIGEEFPDKEYYTGNSDLEQLFNLCIDVGTDISWYENCLEE